MKRFLSLLLVMAVVFSVLPNQIFASGEASAERICEKGCILLGEKEHLENGGECFVWVACSLAEGCEGPDGHEGVCYGAALYDGATTIAISGSNFRSIYVVVNDALYYVDSSGIIQNTDGTNAAFKPGAYTIYYGPYGRGGRSKTVYTGTVNISEDDTSVTASLSGVTYSRQSSADQYKYAESIYWNTARFNHIHVRVAGSYVIRVDGTEHTATVSNPSMIVNVNGVRQIEHAWTNNETYEWTYSATVSRSALIEVALTLDLTYNDDSGNTIVMEDLTVSYDNVNDLDKFIEAIAICDGVEGLDFTVSVDDVAKELQSYNVNYQWRVYNLDGTVSADLPASVGSNGLPASVSGIVEGTEYVYNTEYVEGYSYHDYEKGLLYTFHGWDTYSHSSVFDTDPNATGYTALDDGDADASNNKTIPITADTWINGYWTVSQLPAADAYLVLHKDVIVSGGDAEYVNNYLHNVGKMFIRIDPGIDKDGDGKSQVDADYPAVITEDGYRINIYQYETPFVFTEYQAEVPGYTRTVTVTVSGDNLTLAGQNGDSVTVSLTKEYDPAQSPHNLGTVTYINTYTKNVGDPVSVYPELTLLKSALDTGLFQEGVGFELYSDSECTVKIADYITNDGGLAFVDFTGLKAGTYYLKETSPLAGYKKDSGVYAVTLSVAKTVEELRWNEAAGRYEYVQVSYYAINVTVPEGSDAVYSASGTNEVYYHLHIYNEPVLGSLELSKDVVGIADADKEKLSAVVIVHGPIARDRAGNIIDIGSTWQLDLNSTNNWEAVLGSLPLGEYLIHESFASVHGYTWTNVSYGALETVVYNGITSGVFEVTDETAVSLRLTNTYEEWASADFYIKKVNENGNALPGAVFTLSTDEAGSNVVMTKTSGADGYAYFSGFAVPAGQTSQTYYLRETAAPNGYYLNNQVYRVVITAVTVDGKTTYEPGITLLNGEGSGFDVTNDLLTVVNYPVLGELTITKAFTDGVVPDTLNRVSVRVGGPNGYAQIVELNNSNGWSVTLHDLPLGEYTVSELNASVPGYTWKVEYSSATVTLTEATAGHTAPGTIATGAVKITNTYVRNAEHYEVPTSLTVKKVGEGGEALAGAVFTLDRLGKDGKTVIGSVSFTTGIDGIVVFDLLSGFIDEEGNIITGKYILSETKAPDGYEATDATWTVEIKEDDGQVRVVLNEAQNVFESFWDWEIGSISQGAWADGVLTISNEKKVGSLTISKQVVDPMGLYADAVYAFKLDCSDDRFDQSFTLKANESITIKNIPWGTAYTLTENTTGAAYTSAVSDEGNGRIWKNKTEVVVTNTYKYTEHNNGLNLVKVEKDNTTKTISGAGFTLYADEDLKTKLGSEVFSDENGKVQLPIDAAGTYYLVETTTPAGYRPNDNVYVVTAEEKAVIKNAGTADAVIEIQMHIRIAGLDGHTDNQIDYTYNIENTAVKTLQVSVEKVWDDGNYYARPEAVEVTLYRDNEPFETVTLNKDNDWRYIWDNLSDEYEWSVDEVAVPAEYSKTVKNNGNNWTITNTRAPKAVDVTVTKEWQHNGGKDLPASVTVALYKNGETYDTIVLSAENNWTYTWSDLTDESVWTVDELDVPAGYTKKIITEDGYKFTIVNSRTVNPVEVHVTKVWLGTDGVTHPESVEVVLYRDGKEYDVVILDAQHDWSYSWTDLTDEFEWTVDELSVPSGYNKTVSRDGYDFTITNTYTDNPKTGDFTRLFEIGTMAVIGAIGFGTTTLSLIAPRKKEEDEE